MAAVTTDHVFGFMLKLLSKQKFISHTDAQLSMASMKSGRLHFNGVKM